MTMMMVDDDDNILATHFLMDVQVYFNPGDGPILGPFMADLPRCGRDYALAFRQMDLLYIRPTRLRRKCIEKNN